MTTWLKQSTATDVEIGPFVDDTDFKTPETALTLSQADCQLIKNGGAAAQKNDATSATHLAGGHYKVPLDTTDTNTLGRLRLFINESGALPAWRDFMVVPAMVFDSLISGSDYLEVDTVAISSDTTAANNAEAFFDGTGYAGTNNVIPTVTSVTNAVSANVTQIGSSSTAATNAKNGYLGLVAGEAAAGTLSTTTVTTNLTEATNDHYNGRVLTFISGVLAGQQTLIEDYNGTGKALTVVALTEAPEAGDAFIIT